GAAGSSRAEAEWRESECRRRLGAKDEPGVARLPAEEWPAGLGATRRGNAAEAQRPHERLNTFGQSVFEAPPRRGFFRFLRSLRPGRVGPGRHSIVLGEA